MSHAQGGRNAGFMLFELIPYLFHQRGKGSKEYFRTITHAS